MSRDVASAELPRLLQPDGRRIGILLSGPPRITRTWRRGLARLRTGRLPAMVATYEDGRRFFIDAGDVMYEQVYRLGEHEPVVTRAVRQLLRTRDVAVDVGANHGWYSLVMAQITGPMGLVYTVEPLPSLARALHRNLAPNPSLNVLVQEVVAGERDGTLDLHFFDDLPHDHTSAATPGRETFSAHVVPCRRLDELVADRPPLVKVDVEGFEPEVIAGTSGLVEAARPPMWLIEVNYETAAAFGRRPDAALASFQDGGYSIFRVAECGIVPDSAVTEAPHGATWLCVPEEHLSRVPS